MRTLWVLVSLFVAMAAQPVSAETYNIRKAVDPAITGKSVNRAPSWSTSSLPDGETGTAYSTMLSATDPDGETVTFSLKSGSLPAGLSLSAAGLISGTPTTEGTSNFTIAATDSHSPHPASVGRDFSILINPGVESIVWQYFTRNSSVQYTGQVTSPAVSASAPLRLAWFAEGNLPANPVWANMQTSDYPWTSFNSSWINPAGTTSPDPSTWPTWNDGYGWTDKNTGYIVFIAKTGPDTYTAPTIFHLTDYPW